MSSHTQAATTTVSSSVVVDASIERAFHVFTEDFGAFKPPEHNLLAVQIAETVFEPAQVVTCTTAGLTVASAAGGGFWPLNRRTGW
jgi:hypothetical protein